MVSSPGYSTTSSVAITSDLLAQQFDFGVRLISRQEYGTQSPRSSPEIPAVFSSVDRERRPRPKHRLALGLLDVCNAARQHVG
jgi:hypothetical protein